MASEPLAPMQTSTKHFASIIVRHHDKSPVLAERAGAFFESAMPSQTWALALAELLYYIPSIVPVLYCFWKHKKAGILGWLFLSAFLLLQIVGSILTLAVGENGTPSSTAVTLTSIGLSPLLLAIAGIVNEWKKLAAPPASNEKKRWPWACEIVFHIAVVTATAIYATGASSANSGGSDDGGANTEWRIGILLLLFLWIIVCATFGFLANKKGTKRSRAMFWSLCISLVLLGVRIIYQCVATFKENHGVFNPVTGSIALRIVFQFLPGAFILLALVVGGVMSIEQATAKYDPAGAGIPLASRDGR